MRIHFYNTHICMYSTYRRLHMHCRKHKWANLSFRIYNNSGTERTWHPNAAALTYRALWFGSLHGYHYWITLQSREQLQHSGNSVSPSSLAEVFHVLLLFSWPGVRMATLLNPNTPATIINTRSVQAAACSLGTSPFSMEDAMSVRWRTNMAERRSLL